MVGGDGTVLKRGAIQPLAIQPATPELTWQAYPNLFTTSLTLVMPHGGTRDVRLLDPLGRLVLHQTIGPITATVAHLPLHLPAELAPGIYSLQVTATGQATEVRRLVYLP